MVDGPWSTVNGQWSVVNQCRLFKPSPDVRRGLLNDCTSVDVPAFMIHALWQCKAKQCKILQRNARQTAAVFFLLTAT